jgi:glycosyltransferase involved in cell wall biosynthesis
MKILITTHTQYGKNAFSKHFERATSLANRNHDVTFLITSPFRRFSISKKIIKKVTVIESPDWLWGRLRQGVCPFNLLRRILYVIQADFDLIHCIDSRPVTIIPGLIAKYIRRKFLFVEWTDLFGRGGIISERSSRIYQIFFAWFEVFFEERFRKFADGAFAISQRLKDLLQDIGYPEEQITILPLASNIKHVKNISLCNAKQSIGLSVNRIYLTYVGSIYEKDKQLLLDVFNRVRHQSKNKVQLLLIGQHTWVKNGQENDGIIATGFLNDDMFYSYLRSSDLLLLPLRMSAANMARFPCKINDYLVAQRPIVSTPISDVPELFKRYNFGAVSPSDSVESLSQTIMDVLDKKNMWEDYGREGVRCAKECLSLDLLANEMECFYQKTIYRIKNE